MSDQTLPDEVLLERGDAARMFRRSQVYQSVVSDTIAEHTQLLLDTDFNDVETREAHFRIIRAFQLLDAELQSRVLIAEAVAQRLENPTPDEED